MTDTTTPTPDDEVMAEFRRRLAERQESMAAEDEALRLAGLDPLDHPTTTDTDTTIMPKTGDTHRG